ncbi:MAG: tetratricopeptide repeat protein [Methylophilaceae bacterium]|nr:tetratricopeptide repeat protein [Methylophilaceae bacterium]
MQKTSNKQASNSEIQPLINLLNNGHLAQAETLALNLINSYPNTFILHHVLAIASDGLGKPEQAIISYRNALRLQPNTPDLHFNLGIVLTNTGELDAAAASYRKAIGLNPKFFEAYGNLGTLLQKQGKLEEAVANYRKAISIQPDAGGYFNLATALRDQGRLEDAITSYEKAIQLYPKYADAYNNLGETLRDQGNMDLAVKYYQKTLGLNPQHANANYNMAEFLYLAKGFNEAIPYFERSQLDDWQARSLYCLYKAERFAEFKIKRDMLMQAGKHIAPFIGTLSTHYSINFNEPDPYNFCKNPLDFVYQQAIPQLAEPNSTLLKSLLHDINNANIAERKQGMLHDGKQSAGNLFKRPEASFRALAELVKLEFIHYKNKFSDSNLGANCELIQSFPSELEFTSSWYVKMRQGGHLSSHIHEIGWISGAVYLAMPINKQTINEGAFEYGNHGDDYPIIAPHTQNDFPVSIVMPNVGDIVLFPSSLFHRTLSYTANEERICIAFDLKPALSGGIKSSY